MLVEEIALAGYKRFKMDMVRSFHWTPKSRLGLILSGNGAGKSSLLNEINPMPANKNDFVSGGSKRFVCSLDDVRYKLTSDFSKGQLHSFKRIVGGVEEELNPSGTVTIQKELVEQILRYDNNIHALLTGQLRFTTMSPSQRKELLMDICPLDLGYATKLYDDIRVMARDDQGALKHQQVKCADLESKLASIDITDDEDTVNYLEEMVQKLLPFKGNKDIDLESLWNTISSITASLEVAVQKWDKWRTDIRLPKGIHNLNDLNNAIGQKEALIQSSITKLEGLTKRALEINTVIDQMDSQGLSVDQIKERLEIVQKELVHFTRTNFSLDQYKPNSVDRFNRISSEIENSIAGVEVSIFTTEQIDVMQKRYDDLTARFLSIKQRLSSEQDRLSHLKEDSQSVVCSNCKTKLSISGLDIEQEIGRLERVIENGKIAYDKADRELQSMIPEKGNMERYIKLRDRLNMLIRKDDAFADFFMNSDWHIDKVIENMGGFLTHIQQFNLYTQNCERFIQLQKEKDSYLNALKQHELIGSDITQTQTALEKEIEAEVILQKELKDDITHFMRAAKMYDHFVQITERSEQMLITLFDTFKEWVDCSIQKDARDRLSELYSRLGAIKHLVNQKGLLQKAIVDAHADISLLKERQSDLEVLLSVLSPTKGVVADQMTAFINSYVEQINKVIDQIWEQSMTVLGCHLENGGLDYKFPIDTEGQLVPDISLGSAGMRDVIDLGFVLVMRQYLNLVDYPIFMDETGSTFDSAHRSNLLRFIKNLLDTQQCQQIFMINHYADWHGGLSNYEAVVLDNRNIVVPSIYNQNVKINDGV